MKFFIICLAISSFILIPIANVHAASSTHYYAGYFYDSSSGIWGVKADIYTEWLEMPMRSWAAEWVSVILDYAPLYWIQTGYIQTYTWIIFPIVYFDFYLEVMDDNGHNLQRWGIPIPDITYTYAIWYDSSESWWYYYIADGSIVINWAKVVVVHHTPVDLQAFVETLSTQTNIDGSHFSKISYTPGSGWYYWNSHTEKADYPPYYTDGNNLHYEFYAYGGSL